MMTCKLPLLCFPQHFSYLCFHSIEITPPPTPSPVKAAGGKKLVEKRHASVSAATQAAESDDASEDL